MQLENRIVVPPMSQYSAVDGVPQPWHFQHYGSLAASGPGLIVIEATGTTPEGRVSPYSLGLWSDGQEAAFKQLIANMKTFGNSKVSVQIGHAGRKASTDKLWLGNRPLDVEHGGWPIVAPSPIAFAEGYQVPQELDLAGIERIKQEFVDSARRADRAEFDAIELQFGHGFLAHEFLSPITNKRTDCYGGSLENRMRLPLEIIAAVRATFPEDKPIGIRISATEWTDEESFNLEEAKVFAAEAKKAGIDYICVSSGGNLATAKVPGEPGFQIPLAKAIKETSGTLVRAVGLIVTPELAEQTLVEGSADMVAVGRAFLYDPRWVWHAANILGVTIHHAPQYKFVEPAIWRALKFESPPKI
jgi:NADPH2 dehydrogenase